MRRRNKVFDINTIGLTLAQREALIKKVGLIPIGTVCYRAGDYTEWTSKVTVTAENQKRVTMFWNSLYYLNEAKADAVTVEEHAEYGLYQGLCAG